MLVGSPGVPEPGLAWVSSTQLPTAARQVGQTETALSLSLSRTLTGCKSDGLLVGDGVGGQGLPLAQIQSLTAGWARLSKGGGAEFGQTEHVGEQPKVGEGAKPNRENKRVQTACASN